MAVEQSKVHVALHRSAFLTGAQILNPFIEPENHADALKQLLSKLAWDRLGVLYGEDIVANNAYEAILNSSFDIAENAIHANSIDLNVSENLIARFFKPLGLRYHVLLVEEGAVINALLALQAKKLAEKGYGLVLGHKAMWYQGQLNADLYD
jgi:hypothetical protein